LALPASVVGGETRLKKFTYTFGYVRELKLIGHTLGVLADCNFEILHNCGQE
jgi:hypothetical protein